MSAGGLLIRNIGALASGDVDQPLLDATSVYVEDGLIAAIGEEPPGAAQVLDAEGMLAAPGLWDAHAYPFFGDHTPWYDARGYLEATVRAGTTAVVSAGTRDLPGRARDAVSAKQLAILAQRSWRLDRPLELKVHSATVIATPGLREQDFSDLAAIGVQRLSFLDPLPSTSEARQYVGWARAKGMKVLATCDGRMSLLEDATSPAEAVRAIGPDVALAANGGRTQPSDELVDWLIGRSETFLDLDLTGNLHLARHILAVLDGRDELHRAVLGTGTPSAAGIAPGGVQRMAQLAIGAVPRLDAQTALALATGNSARAFGLPGGRMAVGQPADLILCRPSGGSAYPDALAALTAGGWLDVAGVLLDGEVQVAPEGLRGIATEAASAAR